MNRIAASQGLLGGSHLARLLIGFASVAFLGRFMRPEDFGFFSIVSILFVMAQQFMDLGSSIYGTREAARDPGRELRVLACLLSWRRYVGLTLAIACSAVAYWGYPEASVERWVLLASACGLYLLHYSALYTVFQLRQAFAVPVFVSLLAQVAFLGASVGLVFAGLPPAFVGLLVVFRESIVVLVLRVAALRLLGKVPRPRWFDRSAVAWLKDAGLFSASVLLYDIRFFIGTFFVWVMLPPAELGAFSAAYRLVVPFLPLIWFMLVPLIAPLTVSATNSDAGFRQHVESLLRLAIGVACLLAATGQLLAPHVLGLVYGQIYATGPFDAVNAFRALVLALGCSIVTTTCSFLLLAEKRERTLLSFSAFGSALNVGLQLFLLSVIGFTGAAVAIAGAELALCVGVVGVTVSGHRASDVFRGLGVYLLPTGLAIVLLLPLRDYALPSLVFGSLAVVAGCVGLWNRNEQIENRETLARLGGKRLG